MAKRSFAFSVLDLPIAVAPWTEAVLAAADVVYLVAPLSVPSAYRLAKFLELIRRNDMLHLPLKVVVNRYNAGVKRSNDISVAQFAKAIGRSVDHMIPNDYPLISMSHGQGKPAVRLEQSPFAMAVKDMISADLGAKLLPKPKREAVRVQE
jgi:Flp pilus assembly CpaE family ATPase